MKHLLIICLIIISLSTNGQDKYSYVHFNKLTPVIGTEYVMATIENWGKMVETNDDHLLFINTKNGQSKKVDFPKGTLIWKVEQIKIDSLDINKIVVAAKTVNLDNNKSIDWNDPQQILILSADGQEKKQLTDDKLFVKTWAINKNTGAIVITGHYDTNENGKYDKKDKSEILIFDLNTLKLISKL